MLRDALNAFGNERQLPGKIHLSAGAEDNRRLRDGLTDGSIDPVTSSLGGSGIMGRGGTGDRQESATNLLGFKVSHSASFLLCSVKYKSCYRIRQSFT